MKKRNGLVTALGKVFKHDKREEAESELWEDLERDLWPLGERLIPLPRARSDRELAPAGPESRREHGDTLTQSTDLYRHLALNYIRMLRLDGIVHIDDPDLGYSGDILVAGLEEVSLEAVKKSPVQYTALSYCWQSQRRYNIQRDCYIWCDDWIVPVSSNLHSALYQFVELDDGPRTVWVDAVCINQNDIKEKTAQVSMMGEIYKSVGSTIVWLGYEGKEVKKLFAYLSLHGSPRKKNHLLGKFEFCHEEIQRGLTYLRYCGWFERAWTFQEICLSQRATLQTGLEKIGWKRFVSGWNKVFGLGETSPFLGSVWFDDWRNLDREVQFIQQTKKGEYDLLFLLRAIWKREASDLRDKGYAILGLNHGAPVVPDYGLSVREALARVSRAAIEEAANLDILHYTTSRCYPSWVPSFSSTSLANHFPRHDFTSLAKLEFPALHPKFVFDVQWNGTNLIAGGFAIGRLCSVKESTLSGRSEPQASIMPFPKCAFTSNEGTELKWPSSYSLRAGISSCPQTNDPMKADIPQFISKVKMHDELKCSCKKETLALENLFSLKYALEYSNRRPFDWVFVPFGARAPVILRPDHRKPMPYFNRMCPGYSDDGTQYWETNEGSLSTFVMTEATVGREEKDSYDELNTYREFTEGLQSLKSLSCVYGDFEIR